MERGYVHVDGRCVHYRRWGSGPVVLAIHGSPQSSRAVAALAEHLASLGLCAIAPDTPGNGLSERLGSPDDAAIDDFARALHAFAEASGLGRVGLYGFHTGAAICCAFAALYPERTAAVVLEGLPAWSETERADALLAYLPPFVPRWDGSHMAWVWARMEEQSIFFPWCATESRSRLDNDVTAPAAVHANCMDFLDAGDGYRHSYRAAFNFSAQSWLSLVTAPLLVCAQVKDVLHGHLSRRPLNEYGPRSFVDAASLHSAAATFLSDQAGDAAPDFRSRDTDARGLARGFVAHPRGPVAWLGCLQGRDRPMVFLHESGDSAARYSAVVAEVAQSRPIVAVHLPGHGDSQSAVSGREVWEQHEPTVDDYAHVVAEVVKALGIEGYAAVGVHLGGQIAVALARQRHAFAAATLGAGQHALAAADADRATDPLTPAWDGTHLIRAFRIARWERLFFPWYERTRRGARAPGGDLDSMVVHARALCLLKAGHDWQLAQRAEAAFDLPRAAHSLERFAAFAIAGDPLSAAPRMQALPGQARALPADCGSWAAALAAFAH
jgi:pimeloyl-ACP methyl ester carboxylesterase